jgi:RNA polymerase sigma factor (sigma-70 family)
MTVTPFVTRVLRPRHQRDRDLQSWFVSEILPHQAVLTGFLKRLCKCSSDVPDLRQETYIRVCQSALKSRPRFPKAFLLATARNLAFDKLRRERLVPVDHVSNAALLDFSIDELTPERRLAAQQALQQLTRAFASLPANTKSVIWLRRVTGLSQREAAATLGMDEGALEGHMTRGMRRLVQAIPGGTQENAWLGLSDLSRTTAGRPYQKVKAADSLDSGTQAGLSNRGDTDYTRLRPNTRGEIYYRSNRTSRAGDRVCSC